MSIVQSLNDNTGLFQIALPDQATPDQKALKEKIDAALEAVRQRKDDPQYATWVKQLQSIAQEAFETAQGDVKSALTKVDEAAKAITRPKVENSASDRVGAYEVRLADRENEDDKGISWRDIIFERNDELKQVPPEQLKLKAEIDGVLSTLDVIFPQEKSEASEDPRIPPKSMTFAQRRFQEYQIRILGFAQIGLQTPADPDSARQVLETLQADVLLREGPRVKNGYIIKLGYAALTIAVVAATGYLIIRRQQDFSILMTAYRNGLPLWVGTMIGAWLSFGIRRPKIVFKDLGALEEDMLEPAVRLIFTGLIATTIFFIFVCQMVTVKVGGLSSADIMNHGSSAFLIGMLLGVSEQALPGALTRRASQFVSEVAGK